MPKKCHTFPGEHQKIGENKMTRKEAITVSNLAGQMLLEFVRGNQETFALPHTEAGKTYKKLRELRVQIADYVYQASNPTIQLEEINDNNR